ncbi:MAG: 30S ribosomal protein S6 [Candidatus Berkelbacteria bacterium]|nr:30S ribosomal protein S6 [Candidatus Berkelbacteria bacterium]
MATKVKEIIETSPAVEETAPDVVEVIEDQSPDTEADSDTKSDTSQSRMYLLSALTKDAKSGLDELTALVADAGSKVEKAEDLGLKRLAFPINKHLELSLVSVFFNATPGTIKTLDSELKHAETIERHLLSTWRAGLDEPKRRQAERQKRETEKNV